MKVHQSSYDAPHRVANTQYPIPSSDGLSSVILPTANTYINMHVNDCASLLRTDDAFLPPSVDQIHVIMFEARPTFINIRKGQLIISWITNLFHWLSEWCECAVPHKKITLWVLLGGQVHDVGGLDVRIKYLPGKLQQ